MKINEARLIREIKKRCSYRRLAEIYYEVGDSLHGTQAAGEDLCRQSLKVLYPKDNIWVDEDKSQSKQFIQDNMSYLGQFYWWE